MNDRAQIRVPPDDYVWEQFFGGNLGFFIQREIMDAARGDRLQNSPASPPGVREEGAEQPDKSGGQFQKG